MIELEQNEHREDRSERVLQDPLFEEAGAEGKILRHLDRDEHDRIGGDRPQHDLHHAKRNQLEALVVIKRAPGLAQLLTHRDDPHWPGRAGGSAEPADRQNSSQ